MAKQYFKLFDDLYIPDRWHLERPLDERGQEIPTWLFDQGEPAHIEGRIRIPVNIPGKALDFTLLTSGPVPVVHARAAAIFAELAPNDVQLIPVEVEGQSDPYFLLNITRVVKCIDDETSSEVLYWKPEDERPEKIGHYQSVIGMRIDPAKVGDAQVFRTWGWRVVSVVSEDIKAALERIGVTGTKFTLVTGPSSVSPEERARSRKWRELMDTAESARDATWRTLGTLDKAVTTPIAMNDSWPAHRQFWRVIRREGGRILIVSHGLSDPFYERREPSVGFGLELALETDVAVKNVLKGWPLLLLERVADEVVAHEHVRERVKAGLFSMEVSGKRMPKALVTSEGRVGVLLGVESRSLPRCFTTPYGEVRLVTIKALLPPELEYLLAHGEQGQSELARRFAEDGEAQLSHVRRRPTV
jgi:hypothetical protein